VVKTIDTQKLEALMESAEDFRLINVLNEDAFEKQHIPGSENIPVNQEGFINDVRQSTTDRDQRIVVYCANEQCDASDIAARKLEAGGFTNVYDYAGGVEAWRESGKEVETGPNAG
jgi:rhodanese-related sulfurtransferase